MDLIASNAINHNYNKLIALGAHVTRTLGAHTSRRNAACLKPQEKMDKVFCLFSAVFWSSAVSWMFSTRIWRFWINADEVVEQVVQALVQKVAQASIISRRFSRASPRR